ncbi:hypothetical protein, partial [Dokdonella sp.]|uniref:hypothetical protein n=1 Tax=Dokdonella sp. TaxID=2291710 RepID=UPI003BAF2448
FVRQGVWGVALEVGDYAMIDTLIWQSQSANCCGWNKRVRMMARAISAPSCFPHAATTPSRQAP